MPPFIEDFFSPLAAVVHGEPVKLSGEWSTSLRRTYESAVQVDSGVGPFVEVIDARWAGTFESSVPITGIAMLYRDGGSWAKASPATMNPGVQVSVHARAGCVDGQASFAASLHGAFLPTVPVVCGDDLPAACTFGSSHAVTGRPHLVAEVDGTAFIVLMLQGSVLKVGRNRLWHLRDELASALPADLRQLLVRGRTGNFRSA